jgi:hypothetical protein
LAKLSVGETTVPTLVDLVHLASDLAVFWLAVAIYRWAASVPPRFARLVANDRRAALAAALRRCEALSTRVSLLSTEKESLRSELEVARAERAAALVEARLASRRVAWLTEADFRPPDAEEDTAPAKRDTVRSPPPVDGGGEPGELLSTPPASW